MPAIEVIGRVAFDAAELMAGYPPRFSHPLKRLIVDGISKPLDGRLEFSRWQGKLPDLLDWQAAPVLEQREDVFGYPPDEPGTIGWHLNFADPELFGFYGGPLLAQDEHQVLEHPILGSLREALLDLGKKEPSLAPITRDPSPTPCLIRGAHPSLIFDTVLGPYGNAFAASSPVRIRTSTTYLEPPTVSNILAMAAPHPGVNAYSEREIEEILRTAYVGFTACRDEGLPRRTVVHTGNWGCGAFGGNVVLMSLLQVLAAGLAGVDRIIFHTVSPDSTRGYERALQLLTEIAPRNVISKGELVSRITALGLRWGVSDGN